MKDKRISDKLIDNLRNAIHKGEVKGIRAALWEIERRVHLMEKKSLPDDGLDHTWDWTR